MKRIEKTQTAIGRDFIFEPDCNTRNSREIGNLRRENGGALYEKNRKRKEKDRLLEGGNHVGDGVVEADLAVEIGLPIFGEDAEVVVPAALIEAFADGIGRVAGGERRRGIAGRLLHDGANGLAGGVKEESVPKIARNGLITLTAFADDGVLNGVGDAVGRFMEENFESFGALIPRVGAGDGDAERIDSGVGALRVRESCDVHANAIAGPGCLIDVGETMREFEGAVTNKGSDGGDPAAIQAILLGPKMRAIDGSGGIEGLGELGRKTGVAGLLLQAGEIFASFEILELILDENHFKAEEKVLIGVIGGVDRNGGVPEALFRRGQAGHHGGGIWRRQAAGASLAVKDMMKVKPEAAVKFEDRERRSGNDLLR